MTENEIAKIVVDACYHIHTRLGPGLLESVYVRILEHELVKRGLRVQREVPISFRYDDLEFDQGFRADLVVEEIVILELKSVENLARPSRKQRNRITKTQKLETTKENSCESFGVFAISCFRDGFGFFAGREEIER